jgi:hypothetical protein
MPIYIVLKDPKINLIVAGEIGDKDEDFYDRLFNHGVIMQKDRDGMNMVIPIWTESNIAFMKEVSEKEVKKTEKEMEEKKKGGGVVESRITQPGMTFPGRQSRGKRGGGITL